MSIIKFKSDSKEGKLISFLAVRCIEKGYFLPWSYIKILAIVSIVENVDEICEIALKRKIVFSEQVVKNYLATMKNFGIICKPSQGSRLLTKDFKTPINF